MSIARKFVKPDLFITMTTNPKWTEITSQLLEGQTAQDRPDIVARVFKEKFRELLLDITKGQVFGKSVANSYVIEFQKVLYFNFLSNNFLERPSSCSYFALSGNSFEFC